MKRQYTKPSRAEVVIICIVNGSPQFKLVGNQHPNLAEKAVYYTSWRWKILLAQQGMAWQRIPSLFVSITRSPLQTRADFQARHRRVWADGYNWDPLHGVLFPAMSRKAENSIHIDLVGPRIALRLPMSYNTRATRFMAQRTTSVKASLTRVPRNFSTRL